MDLSTRQQQLVSLATQYALDSTMQSRHGCVLALHGKPLSAGTNHPRCCINGQQVVSCHAEIDALYKHIRQSRHCKLSCQETRQTGFVGSAYCCG